MGFETRGRAKLPSPGPFLAEITNHLDPMYMGSLEVSLIKGIPNSVKVQSDTYIVKYLSPFYGVTSIRFEGTNASDFNDVQKSYGMWMIPPDVGTTVMVIFLDGDPNQGYWIGCVPDAFQNHMIPGIAATKEVNVTSEQRQKYGTDLLPTGEFLKGVAKQNLVPSKQAKPVHPFADRLLSQGLLLDTIRGVTSSSARREVPSGVFGISTPGPLDTSAGAKRGKVGYDGGDQTPVSRLGGSTFVMDDGDLDGQNELVRIRTRTGHQILLHNSQDLIYIANSKGTAWIEMTSRGKIDIYAKDSVSIHTETDFNFRADRDINLEAGRNVNIKAIGNMETNVHGHYFLMVDDEAKISIRNDKHEVVGKDSKTTVGQDYHLGVNKDILISAGDEYNLAAEGQIRQGSGSSFHIGATGVLYESASEIQMNGTTAASAPDTPTAAVQPPPLPTYQLPNRKRSAGWANGNFYKADPVKSIMQRMPTFEPWDQHENVNPDKFEPERTDNTLQTREESGIAPSPNQGKVEPVNPPVVIPGTCDPKYAKEINASAAQPGITALKAACAKFNITSPIAVASILGVAGGESKWKLVSESFNYTSADRLLQVFPSVFKGDRDLANKYVGNPNNSLPEFLYGYNTDKGKGLGNTQPGDGGKYIGRGYIGLTGRANYLKYGKLLFAKGIVSSETALVDNPELVNDPAIAAALVCTYFIDRVKLTQTDPGYFEAAYRAVGFCTPDIYAAKKAFYECFLGQLQGGIVQTGSGTILTTSDGTPVKTGAGK